MYSVYIYSICLKHLLGAARRDAQPRQGCDLKIKAMD